MSCVFLAEKYVRSAHTRAVCEALLAGPIAAVILKDQLRRVTGVFWKDEDYARMAGDALRIACISIDERLINHDLVDQAEKVMGERQSRGE